MALLMACSPVVSENNAQLPSKEENIPPVEQSVAAPTPLPTRPSYLPGTMVDYTAQSGDTLPALATHFNTSVAEIRAANPIIPQDVTTLPPGFPMQIPIYYEPIWSSPFKIIPDIAFVNGPRDIGFDINTFVSEQPGWLKNVRDDIGGLTRSGGEVVDYVAWMFGISPRLLLAILEYQTGALSQSEPPANLDGYLLGYADTLHKGLAQQLVWTANRLNNGYYAWREGSLTTYKHSDGRLERPDPWQNAASVALQFYYSQVLDRETYELSISGHGLFNVYQNYFSNPWEGDLTVIPGSLRQPAFNLPFGAGETWAYTGGPHTAWGQDAPFAAIDFAPASVVGGCSASQYYARAVADGTVVRTGDAFAVLDLDGDGDERTGWSVFYLHLANASIPPVGTVLKQGDPIGYPSCEGGKSTGTHEHIARKYNGEWILASGPLAFNLEGWVVRTGATAYQGFLERNGVTKRACVCSDRESQITALPNP